MDSNQILSEIYLLQVFSLFRDGVTIVLCLCQINQSDRKLHKNKVSVYELNLPVFEVEDFTELIPNPINIPTLNSSQPNCRCL